MDSPLQNRRLTALHLTDEQFAELLFGAAPAAVQAHLRECSQCAEEAEQVSGAIGSFQQQSRLWAERRASAVPILTSVRQPAFASVHSPQAWTAAALMLALAAGIGVAVREHHPQPAQTQIAAAQPVSPATLQADNELLSAIDGELSADESTPASVYSLTATRHGGRARAAKRMMIE